MGKVEVCKKQATQRWIVAATASGTMPRVQEQGEANTFNFNCKNHPWARIHGAHEAWSCDIVVFCRVCGASNFKKGAMQKQCKGKPAREKCKSEPNGLKVIRLMTQGRPPRHEQMA